MLLGVAKNQVVVSTPTSDLPIVHIVKWRPIVDSVVQTENDVDRGIFCSSHRIVFRAENPPVTGEIDVWIKTYAESVTVIVGDSISFKPVAIIYYPPLGKVSDWKFLKDIISVYLYNKLNSVEDPLSSYYTLYSP